MKYEENVWYGWNGGECPVDADVLLDVAASDGRIDRHKAGDFEWYIDDDDANIIAFRVVNEYKEPKEYTIDPRKNLIWYNPHSGMVHVKELGK